jgi:hypothetical protein
MTLPARLSPYESCILPEDVLWTQFKRPFELEAHDPSR